MKVNRVACATPASTTSTSSSASTASTASTVVSKPVVKKMSFMSLFRKKPVAVSPVCNDLRNLQRKIAAKKDEFEELLNEYNSLRRKWREMSQTMAPKKEYPELDELNAVYQKICCMSDDIFEMRRQINHLM